jgi:hypothetical protein
MPREASAPSNAPELAELISIYKGEATWAQCTALLALADDLPDVTTDDSRVACLVPAIQDIVWRAREGVVHPTWYSHLKPKKYSDEHLIAAAGELLRITEDAIFEVRCNQIWSLEQYLHVLTLDTFNTEAVKLKTRAAVWLGCMNHRVVEKRRFLILQALLDALKRHFDTARRLSLPRPPLPRPSLGRRILAYFGAPLGGAVAVGGVVYSDSSGMLWVGVTASIIGLFTIFACVPPAFKVLEWHQERDVR